MAKNGVVAGVVQPVVHQLIPRADPPKRSRAHLVSRGLIKCIRARDVGLGNAIASAYVMQKEVTEWVNDLAAQSRRDHEWTPINLGTSSRRSQGLDVTNIASNRIEQLAADDRVVGRRQPGITSGRLGGSHEPRKDIDIILGVFPAPDTRIVFARRAVGDIIT